MHTDLLLSEIIHEKHMPSVNTLILFHVFIFNVPFFVVKHMPPS